GFRMRPKPLYGDGSERVFHGGTGAVVPLRSVASLQLENLGQWCTMAEGFLSLQAVGALSAALLADTFHCTSDDRLMTWDGRKWTIGQDGKDVAPLMTEGGNVTSDWLVGLAPAECIARFCNRRNRAELAGHTMARLPRVPVEEIDRPGSSLFGVANCTIDLETGRARPHAREDFMTRSSRVSFDPSAKCPTWENF